jgi:hypothetical protein
MSLWLRQKFFVVFGEISEIWLNQNFKLNKFKLSLSCDLQLGSQLLKLLFAVISCKSRTLFSKPLLGLTVIFFIIHVKEVWHELFPALVLWCFWKTFFFFDDIFVNSVVTLLFVIWSVLYCFKLEVMVIGAPTTSQQCNKWRLVTGIWVCHAWEAGKCGGCNSQAMGWGLRNWEIFVLLKMFETSCVTHPTSCPVETGDSLSQGYISWVLRLSTHFHLVLRLWMHGAVPLLPHICLHGKHFTWPSYLQDTAGICYVMVYYIVSKFELFPY